MKADMFRACAALGLFCGLLSFSRSSVALESRACINAHAKGQELRKVGRLVDAKAQFAMCFDPTCPSVVRVDCGQFLTEVERDTPTLVVSLPEDPTARAGVNLTLDGRFADALNGKPIFVDPGEHVILGTLPDGRRSQRQVRLVAGEKNHVVHVTFEEKGGASEKAVDSPPPPEVSAAYVSPLVWIGGGAAIVGLAAFTGFGLAGRASEDTLSRCAPACPPDSEIEKNMRQRYLLADLGLGVLAVGAGVLVVGMVLSHGSKPRPSSDLVRIGPMGVAGTF